MVVVEMKWVINDVNGNAVILPSEPLYCPICGEELLLHDFRCYAHRYPDGQPELRHCDVHLKCPGCGLWLTFGVPVSVVN